MKQVKVIFVCLGNICRSPMAQYICKHLLKTQYKHLDMIVDSAGTSGYHDGEDMHIKTKNKLLENKIEVSNFVSKRLTQKLFDDNDYIFVMDNSNYSDVVDMFKDKTKIIKITDYSNNQFEYVPDPWYTNNFDQTYTILCTSIDNWLKSLK